MSGLEFHPFLSAEFVLDQSVMTVGVGCGVTTRITVTWSVVKHPEGVVLIDTGMCKEVITDADSAWGTGEERLGVPIMHRGQEISAQLAKIGLVPADVRYVVHTHLHGDHAGGNLDLPQATFIAQQDEFDYALGPDIPSMVREYPVDQIGIGVLNFQTINGDLDLFEDGSIKIMKTPGHTPGHSSVLLNLKDTGPIIVSGDAMWTHEMTDEMMMPGICWFASDYVKSRRKLANLQEEKDAKWFFPHDPDTFKKGFWEEAKVYT
ncbi:MAG: N-acyl homoserine lactonase family protein [Actinomycetes bacterium]